MAKKKITRKPVSRTKTRVQRKTKSPRPRAKAKKSQVMVRSRARNAKRPQSRYRVTRTFLDKIPTTDTQEFRIKTTVIKPTKGLRKRVSPGAVSFLAKKAGKIGKNKSLSLSVKRVYRGENGKRKYRWDNIDASKQKDLDSFIESMAKIEYINHKTGKRFELDGGTIEQIRISKTTIAKRKKRKRRNV